MSTETGKLAEALAAHRWVERSGMCACGHRSVDWVDWPTHVERVVERIVADRVREAEQRGADTVRAQVEAALSTVSASWGGAAMVLRDKVRVALVPERKRTSDHTETAAEFHARADRLAGDER